MNKLTKGAIAGAAGIALLLGGAGTFALWNDSTSVAGGTVSTGTLDFGTVGAATWLDVSAGGAGVAWSPTSKIVPGDTITLTRDVTIDATGKNLKADLAYSPSSVAIPTALQPYVTVALTASQKSGDATVQASGNKYVITPQSGGSTVVTVVITIKFDSGASNKVGQGSSIDLAGASYTLTQEARS